jgi:hypothetical protein
VTPIAARSLPCGARALGDLARVATLILAGAVAACAQRPVTPGSPADWQPRAYAGENTVELGVVRPDGTPHWFKVWVVVLGDQPYVRLGSQSLAKIEGNRTKPYVGVRVAGREFEHVALEPAPDQAEAVARAMADKYSSDVVIHLFPHPMTARLRAE